MELEDEQIASLLFDGYIESIFPEGAPERQITSVQDVDFKLDSQLHSGNFVQSDIRAKKDFTLDGKSGKEPKDVQETPKDVSVDPSKVNRTALKKSVAVLVKIADLLVVPQRAKKTKEDYATEVDDLLSRTLKLQYQAFKSFLDNLFEPLSDKESHTIVLYLIQTLGPKYGSELVLKCKRYYLQNYKDVAAKIYKEKAEGSSV